MRIVTVLKSRGTFGPSEFQPVHVKALQRQVEKWAPFAQFTCLSDVPVEGVECVPLKRNWPGWWSKLELFDPELGGDFLFTDLDTLIVGPLDDFEKITKLKFTCWPQLNNANPSGTNGVYGTVVVYKKDPKVLNLMMAQQFTQLPPQPIKMAYEIPCYMRGGAVQVRYPLAVTTMNGLG